MTWPREESALLVPVPEAERLVYDHRMRNDPAARAGVPAHVTILYPFVSPQSIDGALVAALGRVFARFVATDVSYVRVGRFGNVVWLAPDPVEAFVRLMRAVWAEWPHRPPYRGDIARDEVVPHLTVGHLEGDAADALAAELRRGLPIHGRLDRVWLMETASGRWRLHTEFPLSGGAPN